jgi:hypothetical protein
LITFIKSTGAFVGVHTTGSALIDVRQLSRLPEDLMPDYLFTLAAGMCKAVCSAFGDNSRPSFTDFLWPMFQTPFIPPNPAALVFLQKRCDCLDLHSLKVSRHDLVWKHHRLD